MNLTQIFEAKKSNWTVSVSWN